MTPQILFDQIVRHYTQSKDIVEIYKHDNIYRGRQHSISSILEDLFAHFLQIHLSKKFPQFNFFFMVDYGISVNGERMIPDVAIIIDGDHPVLAAYLDIKTDLGYKRNYFMQFPLIQEKVHGLRNSNFQGLVGKKEKFIKISSHLKWRTIVVSDTNISSDLLHSNKIKAGEIKDYFDLYFLSGNKHPNRKQKDSINIYEDIFIELLKGIENDIKLAM